MQKLKKSLCALLSVVMLISVFSFGVNAGVEPLEPTASQNLSMKLEVVHEDGTEATTVTPGETVTVNVYVTAKDAAARIAGGMFLIFWDSNVYSYVEGSRTWGLSSIDPKSLYSVSADQLAYTNTVANFTEEEKAYGWNIAGNFQVKNSAGTNNTNASLIQANAATPFISIQLKVSDSVEPGTAAPIGIPTTAIAPKNTTRMNYTYLQTWTDQSATLTQNKSKSLYVMDTVRDDITVASDEPVVTGPVVAKSKAEVKMTPNSPTTVEDAFQFRVTSVITDADWDTYFANTAAGGNNAITKLGFVAYKGTDGFDLETAKSVAKGGSAAGYDKAETTYVQKETDSSDAYFGAIIQITSAETRSDATYIAYVEYTDAEGATQYAFYDAAQTALLDTNYQTIVDSYLAAYPFAG